MNNEQNKKPYTAPTIEVIEIQYLPSLLECSGGCMKKWVRLTAPRISMHNTETVKQKKEYSTPAVKIIALKQTASLLESSPCVFPACMEVEKD